MNRVECEKKTGVVVLGHGSRASEAGVLLEWIAERIAERCAYAVAPASLQFNSPTLAESCRNLAAAGARRIVVAPYFLFSGNHMKLDIPEELRQLQEELEGVELVLAGSLGADVRLAEIMQSRIEEAMGSLPEAPRAQAPPGEMPQHPIEAESFDIIDGILKPADPQEPRYQVVRRVVHTTGDPSFAAELAFSDDAIGAAMSAFAKTPTIICDVNMVAAGLTPTAAALGLPVLCSVGDEETRDLAQAEGITRGAAGIRRSSGSLAGAVVAIGNAPTALFEVLRLAEQTGRRPALVVGVPVGFVGAAESKEALAGSGLPHITLPGRRGGSNIAAAIVNALMRLATSQAAGRG